MKTKEGGFSLLELAIIVLVLGLLTTLAWRFIAARLGQKESVAAHSLLERADWALTGFVLSWHRLPCPDTDQDGGEDCASPDEVGRLPYRTLGMADARAGMMRYGVLRREGAGHELPDPEALPADPAPALSRSANLTISFDRFYPLLGLVRDFPLSSPTLPLLTTTNTPLPRTTTPVLTANAVLGNVNGIDFCQALRVAEDPAPGAALTQAHVHTTAGGAPRQLAYALALPGALDKSGDNASFDGAQISALAFDPPQGAQTHLSDDRIRSVAPGVLWNRLGCGETVAGVGHAQPNAETAAVMLYVSLYDYEQVLEQALELANANVTIAISGVVGAAGSVMDAASAVLHAAGDVAKAGLGYSVAAAALMVAAAAVVTPLAALTLVSAVEVKDMTEQRFVFLKGLRNGTKSFAEGVAARVRTADEKGLYLGQ